MTQRLLSIIVSSLKGLYALRFTPEKHSKKIASIKQCWRALSLHRIEIYLWKDRHEILILNR